MQPSKQAGLTPVGLTLPPAMRNKGKSMTSLILGHRLKVTKEQLGVSNDSMFFGPVLGGTSTSAPDTDEYVSVNSMSVVGVTKGTLSLNQFTDREEV